MKTFAGRLVLADEIIDFGQPGAQRDGLLHQFFIFPMGTQLLGHGQRPAIILQSLLVGIDGTSGVAGLHSIVHPAAVARLEKVPSEGFHHPVEPAGIDLLQRPAGVVMQAA